VGLLLYESQSSSSSSAARQQSGGEASTIDYKQLARGTVENAVLPIENVLREKLRIITCIGNVKFVLDRLAVLDEQYKISVEDLNRILH